MFLATRSPGSLSGQVPAATVLGVPYDATASHRRGARFAPAAIRRASHSTESYSPILDRDLEDLVIADLGDLDVEHAAPEAMLQEVQRAVAASAGLCVVLGGDHTVSIGAVRAMASRHPDLRLLVLDAHLDLREEYEGTRWSHAATVRRLTETVPPERVILLGVRAGTREEFEAARSLRAAGRGLRLSGDAWAFLDPGPVYLSVDIDVLDPADAPGTGNPEPAGPSAGDLLDLLRVLAPLRVVGVDVVEVSPPYDPSGQTSVLAASLIRESVLTWATGSSSTSPTPA